ncbi:hypothetical protein [Serratia fonticola]|uniref:hypothetical protein n=1 Tax=Serratia fonticola TaxID=47917 RepID=UPI003BB71F21
MSVKNDCVVYVDFQSLTQTSARTSQSVEHYEHEASFHTTIITIEEYERKKIIDELVERAENLTW